MAADSTKDVQRVAQQLFTERSARAFGRDMKQIAVACFRDAEAFLAIAGQYDAGSLDEQIKAPIGIQLSDASAPNLAKTCKNHPHNLVSRRFGDRKKVAAVYRWLKENPPPSEPDAPDNCELESLGISWGTAETRLARILFPEYVVDAKKEPVAS